MTKKEARNAYRAAWTQWCLATDEQSKMGLEKVMDGLQSNIAYGPTDPEWKEFINTLPGFKEFWNNWGAKMLKLAEGIK